MMPLRAIGIILTGCFSSLLSTIVFGKMLSVNLEKVYPSDIPFLMWFLCIASVFIIVALASFWYFSSPKTKPNTKNGMLFGLAIAGTGFFGDVIALVVHENGFDILMAYYVQPVYWATFAVIIAICAGVGYIMSKRPIDNLLFRRKSSK